MKLQFEKTGTAQPDPFLFEDNGKYYLYVTSRNGVEAYSSDRIDGEWKNEGLVLTHEGAWDFWAPSIIRIDDTYYIYVSFSTKDTFEQMHAASAKSPLGPFGNVTKLYNRFSIDPHAVKTPAGLFLFYAEDNNTRDKIGTRVFVDKMLDPMTPANICREIIVPTMKEERFTSRTHPDNWYTIEGPFWFREGEWQYLMYSGGCFENETYHIGYAAAKSDEDDLTKVDFVKHTVDGAFDPVLFRTAEEEGVGHHSVFRYKGECYACYHGRDTWLDEEFKHSHDCRTARICKLHVKDGTITAERIDKLD
ncbi:MAG: family 43 glycosylhydrolase [Clostridia bacterium]|nr:family 43 glycosylhydrolase [Clostridia bacterium]